MFKRSIAAVSAVILMPTQPGCSTEETATMSNHHHQNHNHSFQNVEEFAAKFDDPSRDEWQKPDEMFDFIGLKETDKFAEIGAGTGYFCVRAAKRLKEGLVYAVDSEPNMLQYIEKRAAELGLSNIKTYRANHNDSLLPEPVDIILIVNTYHHIEDRTNYFSKLKGSLAPKGKLVIVEGKAETPMEPPKELRVTKQQIAAELAGAGYHNTAESSALPYQSLQMFQPM